MLSENLKSVLDTKLWRTAEEIIAFYQKKGFKIDQLQSIDEDYRYKPHIIVKKKYSKLAIELRERCNVEKHFENFVIGCQAKRLSVKIFFAVPEQIEESETLISHAQKKTLKKFGVGLLIVGENGVDVDLNTIACSRRFALEAGRSLGKYEKKIDEIIASYNLGECLDAIRDLSELVEDATYALIIKAIRKGKITQVTLAEIANHEIDWAGIIDCLSIRVYKGSPQTQVITDKKFRTSLHSFRDVRNLSDHRKTAKEINDLEKRYPESMHQGTRLLRELIALTASLR